MATENGRAFLRQIFVRHGPQIQNRCSPLLAPFSPLRAPFSPAKSPCPPSASPLARTLKIQFGPFPPRPLFKIPSTTPTLTGGSKRTTGRLPSLLYGFITMPQTRVTTPSLMFQLLRPLSYFIFRAFNIRSPSFPQSPSPTRPVLGLSSQFPNKIFPAPPP